MSLHLTKPIALLASWPRSSTQGWKGYLCFQYILSLHSMNEVCFSGWSTCSALDEGSSQTCFFVVPLLGFNLVPCGWWYVSDCFITNDRHISQWAPSFSCQKWDILYFSGSGSNAQMRSRSKKDWKGMMNELQPFIKMIWRCSTLKWQKWMLHVHATECQYTTLGYSWDLPVTLSVWKTGGCQSSANHPAGKRRKIQAMPQEFWQNDEWWVNRINFQSWIKHSLQLQLCWYTTSVPT